MGTATDVDALLARGDLRGAADRLADGEPLRAAALYEKLLDHARAADCLAAGGAGLAALEAALRAADDSRLQMVHRRVLSGDLPGLGWAVDLYTRYGRDGLASEAAQALGRPREAAALAARAGDGLRAGRLYAEAGDLGRALDALQAALPESAETLGRLYLRLGRPRSAVAALAQAPPGPLLVLAFLRLGLVEAARALDPGVGDPVVARARLGRDLEALEASGFVGLVRVDGPEPGADGCGFSGELDGVPVWVRALPDGARLDATLVAFDPPLPGVPRLLAAERDPPRLVVTRRGEPLRRWLAGEPSAGRVLRALVACGRTLEAAHARGLVHGRLQPDDLRVLPGDSTTLDGWHRRHLTGSALTRTRDADALVAPEVLLGRPPSPAADVYGLARLVVETLDGVVAGTLVDPDPARRPDLDAALVWLQGLRATAVQAAPARPEGPAAAGPRFASLPEVGDAPRHVRDGYLERDVELVACPPSAALGRLRALSAPGSASLQPVLALAGPVVVLEALGDQTADPTALDTDALGRDLARLHASGVALGVGLEQVRTTPFGARVRIAAALFEEDGGRAADDALLAAARHGDRTGGD